MDPYPSPRQTGQASIKFALSFVTSVMIWIARLDAPKGHANDVLLPHRSEERTQVRVAARGNFACRQVHDYAIFGR
jgi:hypothetical protein